MLFLLLSVTILGLSLCGIGYIASKIMWGGGGGVIPL
jgi:hypothetical protein